MKENPHLYVVKVDIDKQERERKEFFEALRGAEERILEAISSANSLFCGIPSYCCSGGIRIYTNRVAGEVIHLGHD
ncbi:MAG: hypothetical protein KDN22_02640 [Verrucomicrobiae bacterium]|nr:hypothetical protein [Verrucomicrobiae bacterium]